MATERFTMLGIIGPDVEDDKASARNDREEKQHVLYMIIERFRNGDPVPVYRRFRDRGRQAPDGLTYVSSWVTTDLTTCYQIMECDDPTLLEQWTRRWDDVCDFEIIPVVTSAEAVKQVSPRL